MGVKATTEEDHGRQRVQGHRTRRHQPRVLEKAARAAVDRAGQSLRDLRVAEVVELDMVLNDGKVEAYRAKIKVSFKFEGS